MLIYVLVEAKHEEEVEWKIILKDDPHVTVELLDNVIEDVPTFFRNLQKTITIRTTSWSPSLKVHLYALTSFS